MRLGVAGNAFKSALVVGNAFKFAAAENMNHERTAGEENGDEKAEDHLYGEVKFCDGCIIRKMPDTKVPFHYVDERSYTSSEIGENDEHGRIDECSNEETDDGQLDVNFFHGFLDVLQDVQTNARDGDAEDGTEDDRAHVCPHEDMGRDVGIQVEELTPDDEDVGDQGDESEDGLDDGVAEENREDALFDRKAVADRVRTG